MGAGEQWYMMMVFQVVILGMFAFVLKMILKPSNPKSSTMTVEFCNEKMNDFQNRILRDVQKIERDIEKLVESVNKLEKKVDNLILQFIASDRANDDVT